MMVDKVAFIHEDEMDCSSLFSGFDDIKAITYSYDLSLISKIMMNYKSGHIILGSERIVRGDVRMVAAHQMASFQCIRKYKQFIKRVEQGELKFSVLRNHISHAKVYLLSANDGRVRVITGSANMTRQGLNSDQVENVHVCDDESYYRLWLNRFNELYTACSDDFTQEALLKDKTDLDEQAPMIHDKDAIVLVDVGNKRRTEDEVDYNFYIENLDKSRKNLDSKDDSIIDKKISRALRPSKGVVSLTGKVTDMLKATFKMNSDADALIKKRFPVFELDCFTNSAKMNNKNYSLSYDIEKIKKNIINLNNYMSGFESFSGDTYYLQQSYYKELNYMFITPFLGILRHYAYYYDFTLRPFPIYSIIYGASDAGKTTFVQMVQHLMFGREFNKLSTSEFSKDAMRALKTQTFGVPILIDDVETHNFNSAGIIVKSDENWIPKSDGKSPAFILTSNKVRDIRPEISKRMFIVGVDNRLTKSKATVNERKIITSRKAMTNDLYNYYLLKMMPRVKEVILKMGSSNIDDEWQPDIYKMSIDCLSEIYKECDQSVPECFGTINNNSYIGDASIGENAKKAIISRYTFAPDTFMADKQSNTLTIEFKDDESTEGKRIMKRLANELPAELDCRSIGTRVIMSLDKAEEYTKLNLWKKRHWWNIFSA